MAAGIGLNEAIGLGLAVFAASARQPQAQGQAPQQFAPVTGLGSQGGGYGTLSTYDKPDGASYVAACFGGAMVGASFGATLDLATLGLDAGAGTAIGAGVGCGVGILGTYLAS